MNSIPRVSVLLACLFAFSPALSARAQVQSDTEAPKQTSSRRTFSPEYTALDNAYKGKALDFDRARLQADRETAGRGPDAKPTTKVPPNPAIFFLPRFQALADKGDGDALAWVVKHVGEGLSDAAERLRSAQAALERLITQHVDELCMQDALDASKDLWEPFGAQGLVQVYDRVANLSTIPETQARALFFKAWARTDRNHTTDPARWTEAEELERTIIYAFPRTHTAIEAAGIMLVPLNSGLLQSELTWIDDVRRLQQSGKHMNDWPRQPLHEWQLKFLPLADAGHPTAQGFCGHFYPAYQQAEGNGLTVGFLWLVNAIADRYPFDLAGWTKVRLGILDVLWREAPDARWVVSSLEGIKPQGSALPLELTQSGLEFLRERSKDPKVLALATFVLAQSYRQAGTQADCERALVLLREVEAKYPAEDCAFEARDQRVALERVMPGAPAPEFSAKDGENVAFDLKAYRGRVVALEFWYVTTNFPADFAAKRKALIDKFDGRPFSLLGANLESHTYKTYHDEASRLGVSWRNGLLYSSANPTGEAWNVTTIPTLYVIDAAGVIRGRNLPWDATVKLIDELVAQTEAGAKKPK